MTFPEPIFFQRPGTPGWKIHTWDDANKILGYLHPIEKPAAIFTKENDSYIQCAGSKTALTVEARVYHSNGSFTHYVFGRGPIIGEPVLIECGVGPITVDKSQVIKMRDARIIIRQFLEENTFPEKYSREDITNIFEPEQNQ